MLRRSLIKFITMCFNPILVGSRKRRLTGGGYASSIKHVSILFQLEVEKEACTPYKRQQKTYMFQSYFSWKSKKKCLLYGVHDFGYTCFNPILVGSRKRRDENYFFDAWHVEFQSYFSWKSKKKTLCNLDLAQAYYVSILFQLEVEKEVCIKMTLVGYM